MSPLVKQLLASQPKKLDEDLYRKQSGERKYQPIRKPFQQHYAELSPDDDQEDLLKLFKKASDRGIQLTSKGWEVLHEVVDLMLSSLDHPGDVQAILDYLTKPSPGSIPFADTLARKVAINANQRKVLGQIASRDSNIPLPVYYPGEERGASFQVESA